MHRSMAPSVVTSRVSRSAVHAAAVALTMLCLNSSVNAAPEGAASKSVEIFGVQDSAGKKSCKAIAVIDASPAVVWKVLRDARDCDPDVIYTKSTQVTQTQRILEQKYTALPVFGSTTCTLKVDESVGSRIDYKLVSSDRLAEFDGYWVLTPTNGNKSTIVEGLNHVKLRWPVPQKIVDAFAGKKMRTRVLWIKKTSELQQLQLAETPNRI